MVKRLAVIPARGGSKRIINKNLYSFYGKPMIYYPLKTAKKSTLFDTIHVSTDSEKIVKVVENLGFKVYFKRSKKLSTDKVGLLPVLKNVITEFKKIKKEYDVVTLIFPCSPLINSIDLIEANKIFESYNNKYPVISVSKFPAPPEWAFEKKKNFLKPVKWEKLKKNSQDLKTKYFDTGDFTFFSSKQILNYDNSQVDYSKYIGFDIEISRAIDIDTLDDLNFARQLFKLKK